MLGRPLEAPTIAAAVKAARALMAPAADTRGSVEYRTYVGGVMVERALKRALTQAKT